MADKQDETEVLKETVTYLNENLRVLKEEHLKLLEEFGLLTKAWDGQSQLINALQVERERLMKERNRYLLAAQQAMQERDELKKEVEELKKGVKQ